MTWTLIVTVWIGGQYGAFAYAVPGFSSKAACVEGMRELKKQDKTVADDGRFLCLQVK